MILSVCAQKLHLPCKQWSVLSAAQIDWLSNKVSHKYNKCWINNKTLLNTSYKPKNASFENSESLLINSRTYSRKHACTQLHKSHTTSFAHKGTFTHTKQVHMLLLVHSFVYLKINCSLTTVILNIGKFWKNIDKHKPLQQQNRH